MKRLLSLALSVIMLLGIIFVLPQEGRAEGQRIVSLSSVMEEEEKQKEEDILQKCLEIKRQVMAQTFTSVNSRLDDTSALKFAEYAMEAGGTFGIDPFLVASIMIKESHVKYKARSGRGAYGLMQINWKVHSRNIRKTFSQIKTLSDLIQPRNNILVGTYIFSCYLKSANGDVSKALSRYLGASGTRYRASVMKYHGKMEKLYSYHIKRIEGQMS